MCLNAYVPIYLVWCVCVCLLVKVGVCESCCVQLWSRWRRPPAPSPALIFFLPPSFTHSPRHTNNLQLGQPWLTLCLYFTHIHAAHTRTYSASLYWVDTHVDALCVCMKWIKKTLTQKKRGAMRHFIRSCAFKSFCNVCFSVLFAEIKPWTS